MQNILLFLHNCQPQASVKTGAFLRGDPLHHSILDNTEAFVFQIHLCRHAIGTVAILSPGLSLGGLIIFLVTTYPLLSFKISFAASIPAAPITPPPGCAPLAPK